MLSDLLLTQVVSVRGSYTVGSSWRQLIPTHHDTGVAQLVHRGSSYSYPDVSHIVAFSHNEKQWECSNQ